MSQQKIILIAGPTASGKSALALAIAARESGAIINADAMQVYDGLPILTAQPGPEERRKIPHELYAVQDPAAPSSAGTWRALAVTAIAKTVAAGRTPVLVGGTGLYFRALFGGLADIPAIPESVRAQAQMLYDESGEEKFRAALAKLDPAGAARIARNDRQRLVRAYEVVVHTGEPLGKWHKTDSGFGTRDLGNKKLQLTPESRILNPEFHLLMPERDTLYAACDRRFRNMIAQGAVEEARAFLARKLAPEVPAMKTLGLRELTAHLCNAITLDQAIAKAQQATRNYAKRQVTWFKNQWTHEGSLKAKMDEQ